MPKKPSSSSMDRWSPWPFYPIAFSAYPFLALLSFNAGPVEPAAGMRSLLISALFGTLLYFLLWLLFWLLFRQSYCLAFLAQLCLVSHV